MAIKPITLSELQQSVAIVDAEGRPSPMFLRFINGTIRSLRNGVNDLIDAQNAINAANAAAAAANTAAAAASTAAAGAASTAAANARDQALVNSYISPSSVLTSTPTVITIAAHTRYYADGTSVAVSGGTIAATDFGDIDYVSYSDPMRAGGTVAYVAATTQPPQTGDTHVVGAVTIPSSGSSSGGSGPQKPGFVIP